MNGLTDILLAGGYGEVGRRIAADLAPRHPGRLIIAGRDGRKAEMFAKDLGCGVRGVRLDVDDASELASALTGVAMIVNCVGQPEGRLLRCAVARGLAYTDVTPSVIWRLALALRREAEERGACVVVGCGLVPGISSVMARAATERVEDGASLETSLLLSVGDSFGPLALEYLLTELVQPFVVVERGVERSVASFTEGRLIGFPQPLGERWAYRVPFADQFSFPTTLGASTAATRLALDPRWLTTVVSVLVRAGLVRASARPAERRVIASLVELLRRLYSGADAFGLVVEARGAASSYRLELVGRNQSHATAVATSILATYLSDPDFRRPGIWFAEQLIPPDAFFNDLAARGLDVSTGQMTRSLTAPFSAGAQ